jgi:hypothetical protein
MHGFSCPPLAHLDRMTDSTGVIQHAVYDIPRRSSGYTTDDNARALRLCARLCAIQADQRMVERVACYLSFLEHAQCSTGGFRNFMSYQRGWLDDCGCGDSQGQAVLALAEVRASNMSRGFPDLAKELMNNAAPLLQKLTSLRGHAYVIQAFAILQRASVPDIDEFESIARRAVDHLLIAWKTSCQIYWDWFEPRMTYANAVLPHAMFEAAYCWSNEEFLTIAESSFRFLDKATTSGGMFWPVGNLGWYARGAAKTLYDQQPVEASTMAAAALTAFQLQNEQDYLVAFQKARGWFHGENSLHSATADIQSGRCYDGLESKGVNRNSGAESTLAYLWTEVLAREAHCGSEDARMQAARIHSRPGATPMQRPHDQSSMPQESQVLFLTEENS